MCPKNNKEKKELDLAAHFEVAYGKLMERASCNKVLSPEWNKEGDLFKKFSLYDESKFKTSFSSSLK